ncbi:MAG: DUF4844 domain-containing protein [Niastella sp.]|nr:DUF4844 domain-containing protein [Niastella sp.]
MQNIQGKIDKLIEFKQRDKFSVQAWNERGLNPSGDELCQYLTAFFNVCTDKLVNAVNSEESTKALTTLLDSELNRLKRSDFDTEEREFICDLFHELASIVHVDLIEQLTKWLYGSVLATLMKIQRTLRPEKIVETLRKPCTKCGTDLETLILRKEAGIPDYSWDVVRCNNCAELNLLSHGPDVKEVRFGNYQMVEHLPKDEYTYEQALTRLEQIKIYRK